MIPTPISHEILVKFIKNNGIIFKNDNYYFKGNTPLTWTDAKKNKPFLKKFNALRKEYVDTLLEEIMEYLKCKPECHAVSTGSTNLDSDYDITIYNRDTSKIIEEFNNIFLRTFKKESSEIFDTNLYGTSFFHTNDYNNYDFIRKDNKSSCMPTSFIYYLNTHSNVLDVRQQRIWAFIKVFMHINSIKNVTDKKNVKKLIYCISDVKLLKDSEFKYKKLKNNKSTYIKELKKYNKLKNEFESKLSKEIILAVNLKEQTSITNFYAKETYFTQGAVNHVVGKLQSKYTNLTLSRNEYLNSMIENLGDIIKEYNLYPKDPIHFSMYAAKYLFRTVDASLHIHKTKKATDIMKVADTLREMKGVTDDIKKISNVFLKLCKLLKVKHEDMETSLPLLVSIIKFIMDIYNTKKIRGFKTV